MDSGRVMENLAVYRSYRSGARKYYIHMFYRFTDSYIFVTFNYYKTILKSQQGVK